jgi:hypothetical protein
METRRCRPVHQEARRGGRATAHLRRIDQQGDFRVKQFWFERTNGVSLVYFRPHAGRAIAVDVTLAVLADYANVSQDGKLNIMGIFQEINAPSLPFPLPQMYLVMSFTAGPAEFDSMRDMRVVLLRSDGQELLRLDGQLRVPRPARAGSRAYMNEAIGLAGITFPQAGDYAFHILVGDDEKANVPLHVNDLSEGD